MAHIVLLGDSIFDNAAYTGGGRDVVTQLRQILPDGSDGSLVAVDGHRTADIICGWQEDRWGDIVSS